MRIVVVAASPDIVGGQSVQALALLTGLRDSGYDVRFSPINPPFPAGLTWMRRLPYARTMLNEALFLPHLREFSEADVVHVFSASYWSFLLSVAPAILAAELFRKPLVLNYHSGEADDHLAGWGPLVHPWLRRTRAIVVPSEYLRDVFARHGYRARVVRNVVDTSCFRFRPRDLTRRRFLSTRNLEAYYRVDNTIRAFALVRRQFPDATLTIAGQGRGRADLERLVAALGVGGVRFLGSIANEMMPALLDECDVFLNSSTLDNQPVSVLEAFAAGLPVISTPPGDIGALVRDQQTGLIVPVNDPPAMAFAAMSLLAEPRRAAGLARNARKYVEAFSWPQVRDQWAAVYEEACDGNLSRLRSMPHGSARKPQPHGGTRS